VLLVYTGLAVTLILVLRQMSRRWREGDAEAEVDDGGPYGPRPTPEPPGAHAADDRELVP